jgi:hypothetical protein
MTTNATLQARAEGLAIVITGRHNWDAVIGPATASRLSGSRSPACSASSPSSVCGPACKGGPELSTGQGPARQGGAQAYTDPASTVLAGSNRFMGLYTEKGNRVVPSWTTARNSRFHRTHRNPTNSQELGGVAMRTSQFHWGYDAHGTDGTAGKAPKCHEEFVTTSRRDSSYNRVATLMALMAPTFYGRHTIVHF